VYVRERECERERDRETERQSIRDRGKGGMRRMRMGGCEVRERRCRSLAEGQKQTYY
jgi:hypothetical protein